MAAVVETQVESVRTLLINLLERQRFSVGVRVLARYSGCTPSQVMASLTTPRITDEY